MSPERQRELARLALNYALWIGRPMPEIADDERAVFDALTDYYDDQDCTCMLAGGDFSCWYRLSEDEQIDHAIKHLARLPCPTD